METPFNQAMLQEIYEGDTDLFVELMGMVQNRVFDDMEEIRTLIRRNEHRQLRHKVHQTKSMLVSIAAGPSVSAAENLEAAVRDGRDAEYSSLFSSLVFEIGALIAYYEEGNWRSHF